MIKADEEIDVMDMETPFVYVFVREDLDLIHQLIQTAHATHEAGIRFGKVDGKISHFCIFGVKNANELVEINGFLNSKGVNFAIFHEPDFDMGYTALATEPLVGQRREIMADFKILRMKRSWIALA